MWACTQRAVLQTQASGSAALSARACIPALGSAARRRFDPSAQDMTTPTPSVCTLGPTACHASPKFALTVFS